MKTIQDVIEYLNKELNGKDLTETRLFQIIPKTTKEFLKEFGINVEVDDSDSRSPMISFDSIEYPRIQVRRNGTFKSCPIQCKIKRSVKYRNTMFSKEADGFIFESVEQLVGKLPIELFLKESKDVSIAYKEFKLKQNRAEAESSKFGLSHAFYILEHYELERLINLIESGKKDEILTIHNSLKQKYAGVNFSK